MLWLVQASLLPWPPLSLEASFSLQDSSSAPSEVPLHVQGQVVRPGETPAKANQKQRSEFCLLDCVAHQIPQSLYKSSESLLILLGTGNPKAEEYKFKKSSEST